LASEGLTHGGDGASNDRRKSRAQAEKEEIHGDEPETKTPLRHEAPAERGARGHEAQTAEAGRGQTAAYRARENESGAPQTQAGGGAQSSSAENTPPVKPGRNHQSHARQSSEKEKEKGNGQNATYEEAGQRTAV
jgi:hypothetical protein